jgi:serine protease Do
MSRTTAGLAIALATAVGIAVGLAGYAGWRAAGVARPVTGVAPSFADIVERMNPAVVQVAALDPPVIEGEETDEGDEGNENATPSRRGDGAGVVIDPSGLVLTNEHLVGGSSRVRIRLSDGREYRARPVGRDAQTDLALLKIEADRLPAVTLGDSDRLRVGDWVVAIGNPLSFEHSVTVGIVSSKGRKIFDASFDAYIQTDAAINPGNSGGPLLNSAGEVVGINAAVSREGQGIGFAIPINVAKNVMAQLRQHGHVSRGYLGVQLENLDRDLASLLAVPNEHGVVVLEVVPGAAAEAAGLKRYDAICRVSGRPLANSDAFTRLVSATAPGTKIELEVWRDGRRLAIRARLGERDSEARPVEQVRPTPKPGVAFDVLGLGISEAPAPTGAPPGGTGGLLIEDVRSLAPGADVIEKGDVVVEVNRHSTPDMATYRHVLDALPEGGVAWLYVRRPSSNASFLAKLTREGAVQTK